MINKCVIHDGKLFYVFLKDNSNKLVLLIQYVLLGEDLMYNMSQI